MSVRNHNFVVEEYYHIYNRGTDKRSIVNDLYDLQRFVKSITEFNATEPIGSIYELSFQKEELGGLATKSRLVLIVAYCINPNHFHLILTPLVEQGVEKFMQRIGGYSRYFNGKYKRNGNLFQGKFKSKHIADNRYLLHLSAYINMNNRDSLGGLATKFSKSSLEEYTKGAQGVCDTSIVLEQFNNGEKYFEFAKDACGNTLERKKYLEI